MHGLVNIFQLFLRVAMLKSPPQELPASEIVLAISIVFALFVGLVRYAIIGSEYYSLLRVVLELLIPAVIVYLLLFYFKKSGRFNQTFAAICGSGAIIYALALPVLPAFFASADSQHQPAIYIIIALDLWSVAVIAYILRHALNVGFATGISLAVVLVLLTLMLVESISPSKKLHQTDPAISSNADDKL